MSNYLSKQQYTVNKFSLELYPYLAAPENRFEANCAMQYGADFKMSFSRGGSPKEKIGLLQLIFPQTKIFQDTVIGGWNVDKRTPTAQTLNLALCLYGEDGNIIGGHSTFYKGQEMRSIAEDKCLLIDTPREINANFANGVFTGVTNTKFANYVVELGSKTGRIYNQGVLWGYSVTQNAKDAGKFDYNIIAPQEVRIAETNEHLSAIARFLGTERLTVKELVA
ncbi:MAG: hypothetical protein P4L39_09645 [Humidesulfovibrio sp.]|nr:hypothetical protein [Humidesulfovibrio sp.]